MLTACTPLSLGFFSKLTVWPAFNVLYPSIWTDEKWANRSSLQPSSIMKPYPLALLNHFTLPLGMMNSPVLSLSLVVVGSKNRQQSLYFYRFLLHKLHVCLHYLTLLGNCRPNPGSSQ